MEMKNVQTFFCHFDHLFVLKCARGAFVGVYSLIWPGKCRHTHDLEQKVRCSYCTRIIESTVK